MTRPEWQSSPNVAPLTEPTDLHPAPNEYADPDGAPGVYSGGRRLGGGRPGPVALAAIAAAVLVVFGIGALVIPPMFSGGSATTPAGGTAAGAAPPPATETSAEATTEPSADPTPSASTKASPTPAVAGNPRLEDQVLALVNGERRKANCDPVRMDDRLRSAARGHSADMALTNRFNHTGSDGSDPLDRMRKAGYPQGLSESIARGQDSAQGVMRNWMRDRGDRANIVNCDAKAIGVGVAFRGRTPYWTLDTGRA